MPTYEFRCLKCDKKIDILMPMHVRNKIQYCADCKGKLKREFTTAALVGFDNMGRS